MPAVVRSVLALCALALVLPGPRLRPRWAQLFPSNALTTHDRSQLTGLRVNLPMPNCATNPSDCADVAVLNTLDGFNIQPRISISFSGPIDVSTVVEPYGLPRRAALPSRRHQPDRLGAGGEHAARRERRAARAGLDISPRRHQGCARRRRRARRSRRLRPRARAIEALTHALPMAMAGGVQSRSIAGLSVFTTQSINAITDEDPRPAAQAGRRTSCLARAASGRCSRSPRSRR